MSEDRCITCGDVAVEAEVVAVCGVTATVSHGGEQEDVAVDLIDGARTGDRLLCHAGVALDRLDTR